MEACRDTADNLLDTARLELGSPIVLMRCQRCVSTRDKESMLSSCSLECRAGLEVGFAQAHILALVQQALKEASVKPKELDGIAYTKVFQHLIWKTRA